jgi:hypothetical protein
MLLQKQVLEVAPSPPLYRKFCCFVSGPAGRNSKFYVVSILNLAFVVCVFGLEWLDPIKGRLFYGYIMLAITSVTQFMMFYVAWKDPGFINRETY